MKFFTNEKETSTRKGIDNSLNNLGWIIDERNTNCNVFTERAKTTEQNKKLKGKEPDYLLYQSNTNTPIAVIEAKKSGQNLKQALDQAIRDYANPLGIHIIFVTDGSIIESYDARSKENLRIDGELVLDFLSEERILKFISEGSQIFSPTKVSHTKKELISIFKEANDLLRKEGIREGIERFNEFSNLLFLKLISEIEDDREKSGEERVLKKEYCWEHFNKMDAKDILNYINDTILPRLVNKYNHSGEVFQTQLLIQNPDTLKRIVDKLSQLQLLNTDSDIKGDAFEYFLKNSVTVGNDLGEYFTPRHIVKLMVDLVDPVFGDKIYDPCAGTGGFLIEAFRHIKKKVQQTQPNLQILREKTIYGRELTSSAKIAKMNMIIIGDGHNNISQMDSLKYPVKEEYDVVLTNFPFSQTTDYSSLYGFNNENANPVFIQHVINALKRGGKAGIVVPEGVLFDEKSEFIKIRQTLLETCNLLAVIKLHEFAFKPYTGQPTSIVIFEKDKQTEKVWFFDVQEDGFKKTSSKSGRPPIKKDDLILLRQIWDEKENSSNSFTISFTDIQKNKYKLAMDNYIKEDLDSSVPYIALGEACDIIIGGTPSRNNLSYWEGNNLWVKISDMTQTYIDDTEEKITDKACQESNVKKLDEGTVLFSFKLNVGKVAIAKKTLYTNEAIAGIIPKDKRILSKYLYYVLPNINYARYTQRATKGKTLNKEILKTVKIPFLSSKQQQEIIKRLDKKEEEIVQFKSQIEQTLSKEKDILRRIYEES